METVNPVEAVEDFLLSLTNKYAGLSDLAVEAYEGDDFEQTRLTVKSETVFELCKKFESEHDGTGNGLYRVFTGFWDTVKTLKQNAYSDLYATSIREEKNRAELRGKIGGYSLVEEEIRRALLYI